MAAHPAAVRRSIGLAGQYAAVDPTLTGRENLALVGALNHLGRSRAGERAGELLDRFGLADAGDRRTKTYSGGMRRRLDLAAALVAEPPVLFLDEPTNGLDPRSRVELWQIIEQLVADGTSLLLTTQYLEEADRLADSISVVDHGKVIAEGTAAELKAGSARPSSSWACPTRRRRREPSPSPRTARGVRIRWPGSAASHDGSIVRIPTTNGPATLARLIRGMDEAGLVATSIAVREPSLDDVFLALTGRVAAEDSEPHAGPPTAPETTARHRRKEQS